VLLRSLTSLIEIVNHYYIEKVDRPKKIERYVHTATVDDDQTTDFIAQGSKTIVRELNHVYGNLFIVNPLWESCILTD
jgi:hypothetical protein